MKTHLYLISIGIVFGFSSFSFAQSPAIGVLSYSNVFTEKEPAPQVIPLFVKTSGKWVDIDELKAPKWEGKADSNVPKSWTIVLDGKELGKYEAKSQKNPQVKPVPIEFNSFLGIVTQKAFALVSQGSVKDPNQWKPARLSDFELKEKQKLFLKLVKRESAKERKHFRCPGFWKFTTEQKKNHKDTCKTESDKIVLKKAYLDQKGTLLAQFVIETDKEGDFEGTNEIINKWVFQVSGEKVFKFVFDQKEDIWDAYLVEAADFDSSGESELLFEKSGYNRYSYELFDSGLKSLALKAGSFH